ASGWTRRRGMAQPSVLRSRFEGVAIMKHDYFGRPAEILLIEDNEGDIRLTQEVLKEGKVRNRLSVVRDGEEALNFLHRQNQYSDAPRPDLILLDLNLPRRDGREVLAEIKQDAHLRIIPVIVLTTSNSEQDVMSAY